MMRTARHATVLTAFAVALLANVAVAQTASHENVAAWRARRARTMQTAPDGITLIRSRSSPISGFDAGFRQDPAFYYLTGLGNAVGALIALDARRQETWLFVPDTGALPGFGAMMRAPYAYVQMGAESAAKLGVEHIAPLSDFESFVDRRLSEDATLVIRGPFRDVRSSTSSTALVGQDYNALWEAALRARWPAARFGRAPSVNAISAVKDSAEIVALRAVAASSAVALKAGMSALRPGRRQRESEVEVLQACIRAGADGISFWPWVMTGVNSSITAAVQSLADYRYLDRVMQAGELARVDVGCTQAHYEGDVGRTAPVSGRFTAAQREAWDLFVAAYRTGLSAMRPGRTSQDVFAAWRAEFERRRSTITTTFGRHTVDAALASSAADFWQIHGVGVANAEGILDTLRAGHVVALEPILIVDGVGLFLEDMILITPTGTEVLTTGLPYTAIEIELAMRQKNGPARTTTRPRPASNR